MDIDSARLIILIFLTALPAFMVLGILAILGFPRRSSGYIPDTKLYDKSIKIMSIIIIVSLFAFFIEIFVLTKLDYIINSNKYTLFYTGVILSSISIVAMLSFLFWYLKKTGKI